MSTKVAPISTDLAAQNDQLWGIIADQRRIIQDLQKALTKVTADRDSLLQSMEDPMQSPAVPPRSPYRVPSEHRLEQDDTVAMPPALAIIDKDAQQFAQYQESQLQLRKSSRTTRSRDSFSMRPPPATAGLVRSSGMDTRSEFLGDEEEDKSVRRVSSQPQLAREHTRNEPPPIPVPDLEPVRARFERQKYPADGITVGVIGSNIVANEKGRKVVSFTISVRDTSGTELWRIEKRYSDFLELDTQLKSQTRKIGKLPDKALFTTHAPTKVDKRKIAIEQYLQHAINLPLSDISALRAFIGTDIIDPTPRQPGHKQGYLTKRGKNFGGWKRRYFILDGPVLKYYENKEGPLLGKIDVRDTQIARQNNPPNSPQASEFSAQYRHAFLILERKLSAPNGVHQHTLCADTDAERDDWVECLSFYLHLRSPIKQVRKVSKDEIRPIAAAPIVTCDGKLSPRTSSIQPSLVTYYPQRSNSDTSIHPCEVTRPESPLLAINHSPLSPGELPHVRQRSSLDQSYLYSQRSHPHPMRYSGLTVAEPTSLPEDDIDADGQKKTRKANRRTFWGKKIFTPTSAFLARNLSDTTSNTSAGASRRAVFGVPLDEAIAVAKASDNYELPAVVYRCIEYLEAKNAILEEGIYRLSGSAVRIKTLKKKFDEKGDVNLLKSDEEHDIHAIAGLLKLWLRELPGNVLTYDLLKDFLGVIDLIDRQERVNELGRLVSMLPFQNYTLLRTLTAHLIRVVQNSELNKMTVRNVGIVFSPTLGIPAGVFSLLLCEFDYIFWTNGATIPPEPLSPTQPPSIQLSSPPPPPHHAEQLDPVDEPIHPTETTPQLLGANAGRMQQLLREEQGGRNNRNSVHYMDGAPEAIVGLEAQRAENIAAMVDDDEEDEVNDFELTNEDGDSVQSEDPSEECSVDAESTDLASVHSIPVPVL